MRLAAAALCLLSPLSALLLAGVAEPAHAQGGQPASAAAGIYTCIDDQGRKITADRPIASCSAREQRVLNRDGSLKAIYPPTLTVEERAAKDARERRMAEARAAQADAVRRDRNLLVRYPSEKPHDKAREAALDTVRSAMKTSEQRMHALESERKPLQAEAEFYKGRTMPAKLHAQLDAVDVAERAQREAMLAQQAELARINQLYDAELARLRLLWAGAAPGSLGPLDSDQAIKPVAAGEFTPKRR